MRFAAANDYLMRSIGMEVIFLDESPGLAIADCLVDLVTEVTDIYLSDLVRVRVGKSFFAGVDNGDVALAQ